MPKRYNILILLFIVLISSCLLTSCEQRKDTKGETKGTLLAPDFALQDLKGKTWKLSDLKGKVVFINFWATWCPPCREEMPSMEALHRDMADKPFQILTILSNDEPKMADTFARKNGYTFPILVDRDGAVSATYGITGVPETFIVNADGLLLRKFIGPYDWNSKYAKDMIRGYLPVS